LVVIIDNNAVIDFSTLRKRRKRSENRVVLRKKVSTKRSYAEEASKIVVDKN
jgi:hypothetical protein